MYPVIQHPGQDAEARQKLAALEKRKLKDITKAGEPVRYRGAR